MKSLTRFVFGLILLTFLNQTQDANVYLLFKHPIPESNCRQYILVMYIVGLRLNECEVHLSFHVIEIWKLQKPFSKCTMTLDFFKAACWKKKLYVSSVSK